jgi:hypothetical protein
VSLQDGGSICSRSLRLQPPEHLVSMVNAIPNNNDFETRVLRPILELKDTAELEKALFDLGDQLRHRIFWSKRRDKPALFEQRSLLLQSTPSALRSAMCERLGIKDVSVASMPRSPIQVLKTREAPIKKAKKKKKLPRTKFLSRKPPQRKAKPQQPPAKAKLQTSPKHQTAAQPPQTFSAHKNKTGMTPMSVDGSLHPMATAAFLNLLERAPLKAEELVNQPVAILGDGPWPSEQLSQMLKRKRVYAISLKPSVQAVIVGRSNVDTALIKEWLGETYATNKVYPQELFVLYVLTGIDPLEAIDKEHADHWVREHPVLRELFGDLDADLAWSFLGNTEQNDEEFDEDQEVIHLPEGESPLVKMGYIVGTHFGLPPLERREILKKAFEGKIPRATNHENIEEYMKQWGAPKTSQRLWRIAKHLAGQVYLKRRNPTMEVAVSEWSADLKWLRSQIYPRVRYRFRWPRDFN